MFHQPTPALPRDTGSRTIFCYLSLLAVTALLSFSASAAILNTDGSATDVQNKINAAASGDTVLLPASGSFTWNAGVSIPNTKGITLDCNGSTIIRGSTTARLVSLRNHPTVSSRVTGGSFRQSGTPLILDLDGSFSNAKWRIDHCTFTSTGSSGTMVDIGTAWGVIDNCNFYQGGNSEMIHNMAYGPNDTTGWGEDVTPGSINAVYIEDCTFTNNDVSGNPAYFWGNSAIQNYYGARIVFRYNTLSMSHVDVHGTPNSLGGRWFEIYGNSFNVVQNGNQSDCMALRAGSGVVFSNRTTVASGGVLGGIVLREEDTGPYPELYQIGRGKNQTSDPAYFWGNDSRMNVSVTEGGSLIQQNRDYYLAVKPNYTPLVYPHPLRNGATPPPNRAPIAQGQSVNLNENTTRPITFVATDADGDNLTYSTVATPAHGTLSGTPPNVTYTPTAGYVGSDSLTFKANDGKVDSTPAPVAIMVNETPIIQGNPFYVDQDNPNASDTASAGTENQPWRTISYALSRISGGATILIKESSSPYSIGTGLYIYSPSGTAQSPTTLKAYPGHAPRIRGSGDNGRIALDGVSYWLLEGLDISNLNHLLAVRNGASFVTVRNNTLHDSGGQIVHVHGGAHDILFENNRLINGGSIGSENGEAFYIGTHGGGDMVYNITIRSNYISGMEHEGIEFKHDSHHCIAEYNILTNCVFNYDFGKWSILVFPTVSYSSNPSHIIRGNIIQSVAATGTGAGIGIKTGCYVYNNIVYNVTSPAYAIEIEGGDSYTRYLWHNTLDVPSSRAVNLISGTASIGNNIGPATSGNMAVNGSFFVSAANRNYRLASGSAPINAGGTVPFAFSTDYDRGTRVQPFDMGAFEFGSGGARPTTPPNLRVVGTQ